MEDQKTLPQHSAEAPQASPPGQGLSRDVIRRLPLLNLLSDAELDDIVRHMWVRHFPKQGIVISKGCVGEGLMFLLTGSLQVVDYTEDGREVGLNLIAAGSFFGELSVVDDLPRSASAIALTPSAVAYLPRDVALRLIYGKPAVAEQMMKHFAKTIRHLSGFQSLLAIPNAYQRVYALLSQARRKPGPDGEETIENLPTQQQIAIMVNTSRETVSRAIAELVQRGILKKNCRTIVVQLPQKLQQLASGSD